jgi:hypothetical protein
MLGQTNHWDETGQKNRKIHKKTRPPWSYSERDIMKHLLQSHSLTRRFQIACMYWLENRTAKDVANHFHTTINAVRSTLYKLKRIQ